MMTIEELVTELADLEAAIGASSPAEQPDICENDWSDIIQAILNALPAVQPATDTLTEHLHASTFDQDRLALAWRVGQVQRALDDVPSNFGTDYGPTTTVLLPASYARRFELLVGKGVIPLAWVRSLDACRF